MTVTEQDAFAASVAPDKLTELLPATAVCVPLHVLVKPFGVVTTRPAGRESVKPMPVRATAPAAVFAMLNVKLVDVLSGIVAAPNDFAIDGGGATVNSAVAVLPLPPLVEDTLPVTLVY